MSFAIEPMKGAAFRLALLLALLLPFTANAQYVKPPGVPTAIVQDYNVEVGVWAVHIDSLGDEFAAFQHTGPSGTWSGISQAFFPVVDLQQHITADGGAKQFIIMEMLAPLNQGLALAFPKLSGSGDPVTQLNQSLGLNFTINPNVPPILVSK